MLQLITIGVSWLQIEFDKSVSNSIDAIYDENHFNDGNYWHFQANHIIWAKHFHNLFSFHFFGFGSSSVNFTGQNYMKIHHFT